MQLLYDRPARLNFYEIAGRSLTVESNHPQLAAVLDQLFAGWRLTPVEPTPAHPQVIVRCYCGREFPEIRPGLERFNIAAGGVCYADGDGFFVDLGTSLIKLMPDEAVTVELWFKQAPDTIDANVARATSFAICAGLRRYGLFEVHAAGLSTPDARGVLVIGPSGSGKSTLTLNLVSSGWDYLSDDEVLLSRRGRLIEACGFRNFFAVSSQILNSSGLKSLTGLANLASSSRVSFYPVAVFNSKQLEATSPRFLLFTRIGDRDTTHLTQLSQAETMIRLLRSCPWATYDKPVGAENLNVLSALAHQARGFDLAAGRDLLYPGRAAEKLLPQLNA